ncbi:soluble quino protein glucose dehydrogenase [Aaosphaeria arxii CBS 175.79]|uniref:Soluble quino protein glucose dehydrogenase n=1 Tax=Aaosphaeria arxii CBS 175.79 TaxID=1450172 RepID=A0A6A5Y0B1_9PLEO|nr:soluble quino protein glucose dehydrogenase [Aaosphaeria arxii CBS 175.79]KAF2018623.1 soluble quino protein glucose dehydrogenase [Aaosphaeria arxii CBS 175.79]
MMAAAKRLLVAFGAVTGTVHAQQGSSATSAQACSSTISPQHGQPSVAPGWTVQVVASGLSSPRGLKFDSEGNLLVVQQDVGISRLRLTNDDGACVKIDGDVEDIIPDADFNHGIELSGDGRTLYASTPQSVYEWDYDPSQGRNTSDRREIIGEIGPTDGHVTRTLLMSRKAEGILLVSRGSMSNLDLAALDITTGVSTIKAFNVSNVTDGSPYNFARDGSILGWGLRNSVGVAEDPVTGGVFSVENSVDNFNRNGQSIYEDNPGEELNFHGYLNGTETPESGRNFGYPTCYAAWDVSAIPDNEGIQVGTQFAIGEQNATVNDTFCQQERQAPRLTFQAHQAPLDIKFNSNGTAAWVTFHGSWNRDDPIGYKLSVIPFANGQPIDPANSTSAAISIVSNPDTSACPRGCFRPVGLAWDSKGRLFMSSDSSGEIFVVVPASGGSADEANPTPSGSGTGTGQPSSTSSPGAAVEAWDGQAARFATVWAAIMALPFI